MKLKAGQFYGKTSRSLEANGFRFTEKRYNSYSKLPNHAHELAHFCFVLAGNYNEKIGSKNFERKPTAFVYYPSDVSHAEEHFANGRHFLVEIEFKGLDRVREYGAKLSEPVFLNDQTSLQLALRMYKEFSERDIFSSLALESISTELLIAASRKRKIGKEQKPLKWFKDAKEYLRFNFAEPPSLTDLAKAVNVHPTHLARVFRQFERCTASDYIRKVRIENARSLILTTEKSLSEIALETGFSDQAHFSRSFKKITGLTPTEFRTTYKSC